MISYVLPLESYTSVYFFRLIPLRYEIYKVYKNSEKMIFSFFIG